MSPWPVIPLNPAHGQEGPLQLALIDEQWCIGCTLCLSACPTDAILGSNKRMHTVIERYCTGCELCIPVCPVDCISLIHVSGERTGWDAWSPAQADQARQRYRQHQIRTQDAAQTHEAERQRKAEHKLAHLAEQSKHADPAVLDQKRRTIEAILAKARAKAKTLP